MDPKIKNIRKVAKAKVNLALHVIGKLENGYHVLDSLVGFPDIGDILTFTKASKISLSISGPFADDLVGNSTHDDSNIIIKAAKLACVGNQGAKIHLTKNLPVASGIGGGSTDAAATLIAIAQLWNNSLPIARDIIGLGADVPACLSDSFKRMGGIGEKLLEVPKPSQMWIVLVNCGLKISTQTIFDEINFADNEPLNELPIFTSSMGFCDYLLNQRNDLEKVVCNRFPEVQSVLKILRSTQGSKLVRMSGSGSTCFALYFSKKEALSAESSIQEQFNDYWVKATTIF